MSVSRDTLQQSLDTLPEGWVCTSVRDLVEAKYRKGLTEATRKAGKTPVYGSNGLVGWHDEAMTNAPTIIVGRKGTVGAVHLSLVPCWPIDTTYYIDDLGGLCAKYLYHSLAFLGLSELDTSSAIPGLNRNDMYSQVVAVPPLAEQERIVAKLEEVLARVNNARERLAKVPAILKRFRQSVLAAACSGRLTADWREQQPEGTLTSFSQTHGDQDEGRDLPDLPTSWQWRSLGSLGKDPRCTVQTGPFGAQLHRNEFISRGVPVIAVGNLTGMGFSSEGLYYISEKKAQQLERYDVQAGDVLFARSGATLGKVCVAPKFVKNWRMTGHILRVRLYEQLICSKFAVYALHGDPTVKSQVFGNIRGMTRPGFNTSLLAVTMLPLPPIVEQKEIVRRVEVLFALADNVQQRLAAGTTCADKLTQSTLAKAFRGELVPTEAELARAEGRSYESAAVLLERIRHCRQPQDGARDIRTRSLRRR